MKTKSYKIYTGDPSNHNFVELSESVDEKMIKLSIAGGGSIWLDYEAWIELCGMKYELSCIEPSLPEPILPEELDENDSAS